MRVKRARSLCLDIKDATQQPFGIVPSVSSISVDENDRANSIDKIRFDVNLMSQEFGASEEDHCLHFIDISRI